MRIGLVCEGPSDVPAIIHFFGSQLRQRGIEPNFRNLFPEPDRTRAAGGWSNLMLWLKRNPAKTRIARYFSEGLFGGDAVQEPLDAIIIQIDADIVEERGFQSYVEAEFGLNIASVATSGERGQALAEVLDAACELSSMVKIDRDRHVSAIAVESTETWCLAAFRAQPEQFEEMRGEVLTNAFMQALEISESRQPQDAYVNCDKDAARRERFCATHAAQSSRIVDTCPHFAAALVAVQAVAP